MVTPREALRQRRDDYIARISIFDWVEKEPAADRRAARIRKFFAGGDDVTDTCQSALRRPPRSHSVARGDPVHAAPGRGQPA
jgi:hypothetical protein